MKSLFSRFKQHQSPPLPTPPPSEDSKNDDRPPLHFDAKDRRVQNLKSFFEGSAVAAASAPRAGGNGDATVRVKTGRASFGGVRQPIPAAHRSAAAAAAAEAESEAAANPPLSNDAAARIPAAGPGPGTRTSMSLPPTSSISAAAPREREPRERPPSRSSVTAPTTSSAARARGISITSGTSGSSGRSVPRHARTSSTATTGGLRPTSLVLTDIDEWVVRSPIHRMSLDNVKKVAFQSGPSSRNANASESDLRGASASASAASSSSAMGAAADPPSRRRFARRASSPVNPQSVTPTNAIGANAALQQQQQQPPPQQPGQTAQHPRGMSRSSSRTSLNAAHRTGASNSVLPGSSLSPSKSATSVLAPSDASTLSAASYLPIAESWSAAMDEELIANLGPRERVRQEVLWEIVNSEERYVHDLIRLNETFCRALLPAREGESSFSLPDPLALTRVTSPVSSSGHTDEAHLPIAAQFSRFSTDSFGDAAKHMSSPDIPQGSDSEAARQNAYNMLTRSTSTNKSNGESGTGSAHGSTVGTPGASVSIAADKDKDTDKPLPRLGTNRSSSSARKRLSFRRNSSNPSTSYSRLTSRTSFGSSSAGAADGPITLPDDLEQVLTVISNGILEGHIKQVTALRKRYDEQFPLVRSLANVFTSHSELLREYATYILHLERALAQVDEALVMAEQIATGGRRSSRRLEETQLGKLSKLLSGLEDLAAERGEAGLSISLSKPFQRLLKYPLLFQNLLYNTSPSTREYEATLAMVDEVQKIVRTIEDEKTSCEERERSRDAWARIEGMEKNKQLMAPKPKRLLVSETAVPASRAVPVSSAGGKERKERKSHRLSDILKSKNHDQWIVRFTDVSLLCEHIGTTTLPMTTKLGTLKSESLTDLSTKRMSAMGRRHGTMKPRNLYKFLKVYEWHELKAPPPKLTVEKPVARRILPDLAEAPTRTPEKIVPLKTGDEATTKLTPRRRTTSTAGTYDDGMSDKVSVMSFAFRGEARPNPLASNGRLRAVPLPPASSRVTKSGVPPGMGLHERRGSTGITNAAQAKFGHRLRASDDVTVRPPSRVRRSLPPAMALSTRATNTPATDRDRASPIRPPWNSSTRPDMVSDFSRPTSSRAMIRPKTSAGTVKDTTVVGGSVTPLKGSPQLSAGGGSSGGSTGVQVVSPATAAAAATAVANATATGSAGVSAAMPAAGAGNGTVVGLGMWEERPGLSAATAARIARRNLGGHI